MRENDAAGPSRTAADIRFGLIGCGDIGVVRSIALARANAKFVAVSDINAKAATGVATRHGAVFDRDWHTLLARPDIDAVVISTPPALHAEMCIAALQSGKHVLCEKPLARNAEECRAIIEAARRANRVLAVGFNYRFYPSFALAREVLASGRIGELSHVRAYAGYSATSHNQAWVKDADVAGGGALHDNGIHLIDLVRSFLGEVEEVNGWATNRVWGYGRAEDNGFLMLRSPENRVATLHASWTEWNRYQFRIELVGSLGKIDATCFPMRTEIIWSERTGGRSRRRRHSFLGTMVGEHARSYRWVVARSFVREFEAFAQAMAGRPSQIATGIDGLRAIEIAASAEHLGAPGATPGRTQGSPARPRAEAAK
jgi:predicted dehydrogenase